MEEKWNVCSNHWKRNFECFLKDTGKWRLENKVTYGKWIFNIKPINSNILAPTFADQRNFFTGLFEAEWRNDNFIFPKGYTRPPQRQKKIQMFKDVLDVIAERSDIKDTEKGISFYIDKLQNENDSN